MDIFFHHFTKRNYLLGGEKMTEFIWYWTKGKTTFYTRMVSEAEKVMKDGHLVFAKRLKPSIMRY
jgi:hypothetical protein